MDNSTEKHEEKIIDAFVSRGVYGACLVTSTLLIHRLQAGEVIEGYLAFDDMKSYLHHYWCSIGEVNHDLGSIINKQLRNSLFKGRLSQIPPIGNQYVSGMNEMELKELEAGFRRYTTKLGKRHRDGFQHCRVRNTRKLHTIASFLVLNVFVMVTN